MYYYDTAPVERIRTTKPKKEDTSKAVHARARSLDLAYHRGHFPQLFGLDQ